MKVLVVDDEPTIRHTLQRLLSGAGYAVTTAESGMRALALQRDDPADVILTDWVMPGMGGDHLIRAVHAFDPGARFLVVTGYDLDTIDPELEVFRVLPKPISPTQLFLAIEQAFAAD